MKLLEIVWEKNIGCQLITCNLASCLAREQLMPFLSCDRYKRNTMQRQKAVLCFFVDLENEFYRVPREVVRDGL